MQDKQRKTETIYEEVCASHAPRAKMVDRFAELLGGIVKLDAKIFESDSFSNDTANMRREKLPADGLERARQRMKAGVASLVAAGLDVALQEMGSFDNEKKMIKPARAPMVRCGTGPCSGSDDGGGLRVFFTTCLLPVRNFRRDPREVCDPC